MGLRKWWSRRSDGMRVAITTAIVGLAGTLLGTLLGGGFVIRAAYIQADAAASPQSTESNVIFNMVPLPTVTVTPTPTAAPKPTPKPTQQGASNTSAPTATPTPEPTPIDTTPSFVYLDAIDAVDGSLNSATQKINKRDFTHSLYDELGGCSTLGATEYVLPENASRFKATVGLSDDSRIFASKVKFTVFIDKGSTDNGAAALKIPAGGAVTVSSGAGHEMDVPVEGRLRIRLEAQLLEQADGRCSSEAIAVWGDPRIELTPEAQQQPPQ